jgi:hypothetical protein
VTREHLIDRKHQVIAELRRCQRELEQLRLRQDRHSQRHVREMERRVDALMAEEARLRQEIDRKR